MAIGFDASGSQCSGFSGAALTLSNFTVGAGSNRCLFMCICLESSNINISNVTLTPTYNGVAGSAVSSVVQTNKGMIAVYRWLAPATGSHACAVGYSGGVTIDNAQVFMLSLNGVDQTTPVASTNTGAENACATASFPTNFNMPIANGTYGFQFGYCKYASGLSHAPSNPLPFTTLDFTNAAMVTSGGPSTAINNAHLAHGAYGGGSTNTTWDANRGGVTYDYMEGVVSLNEVLPLEFNADTMVFGLADNPQTDEIDLQFSNADGGKGSPPPMGFNVTLNPTDGQETDMPITRTQFAVTMNPWQGFVRVLSPLTPAFGFSLAVRRRRFIWPPKGLFPGK